MTSLPSPSALVVGTGSIGRRHLRNLRALGVERLAACDVEPTRAGDAASETGARAYSDLDEALADFQPNVVFVCTPPVLHVKQALAGLQAGADVFVEKPLGATLEGVDALADEAEKRAAVVQVGYNLHFDPALQKVKELVDDGAIGRPLWARIEFGQFLPDWRPTEDYRASYTARRALGGGIILDASHELAYAVWLLGRPVDLLCMAGRVSDLDVDVEDCATILLRFESGVQADVHMDFVQRTYSRGCKLAGSEGTVEWDEANRTVTLSTLERRQELSFTGDPGQPYVDEIAHFLECVETRAQPRVSLALARTVLEVAVAARDFAETGSHDL